MIYYEPERANPKGGVHHQRNKDLGFREHLHDSFEFIYAYDGVIEITIDGRSFELSAGKAALIFPNQIHSAHTKTYSNSYLCIFQKSLVGEFCRTVKGKLPESPVFSIKDSSIVERLQTATTSRYLIKSYLYELIYLFDSECGNYVSKSSRPAEHIGQILTFIADNHSQPITMKDAARQIGYDHHYLSNLLQKGLNITFRTLLNEYRVSHAKYLLLTTTRTVSSIASECGYDSLCSFNRNFREIAGITPSEYRKSSAEKEGILSPYTVILSD